MDIRDMRKLFECPVCEDSVVPPVTQCKNGHIICESCRGRVETCPVCRVRYDGHIVNLTLAHVSERIAFQCKFKEDGCEVLLKANQKRKHEEHECLYIPIKCPAPDAACHYTGKVNEIFNHLNVHHSDIAVSNGSELKVTIQRVRLHSNIWTFMMNCFDQHFLAVFKLTDAFTAVVYLIGSKRDASNYLYQIQLQKGQTKTGWQATTMSISENFDNVRYRGECLIIEDATMEHFKDNESYNMEMEIKKITI